MNFEAEHNKNNNNNPWLLNSRSKRHNHHLEKNNGGVANSTIHEAMNETEFDQTFYNNSETRNVG